MAINIRSAEKFAMPKGVTNVGCENGFLSSNLTSNHQKASADRGHRMDDGGSNCLFHPGLSESRDGP